MGLVGNRRARRVRLQRTAENLAAIVAVASLIGLAVARGGGPSVHSTSGRPSLRLAYFPNLTHAPALVAVSRATLRDAVPRYEVQGFVVNTGPEAMEAMLAGAIDAAYVGPSPAINTFLKSKGTALRIVAGVCEGGASLMARSEVPIRSVRDLAGRRVAVPQLGGTQDVSLRHFLAANGLRPAEAGGTVQILPIKNPDILTLFKRRQIDAAWVPEPWATRLRAETGATRVVDERELWPGGRFTTTILVVSTRFQREHPDAVAGLIAANQHSIAWINDRPAEAAIAINRELKRLTGKALPPDQFREAMGRLRFSPDPNMPNILAFAEAARDAGYLRDGAANLAGLIDQTRLAANGR